MPWCSAEGDAVVCSRQGEVVGSAGLATKDLPSSATDYLCDHG